jgi:hypothetical protein
MDMTITFDEVTTLLGNIPSLKPHPNFERIRVLHQHFKRALQRLPCPQSTLYRWKGLVMVQELYALLTPNPFHLPTDPGPKAVYVLVHNATNPNTVGDTSPLTRTEQATNNTTFACCKHYFLSMRNMEQACFTALNASVPIAFQQVSKDLTIQGWHAGMSTMIILDQLSELYGHPTPAVLESNNRIFSTTYSAADPPEVLFRRIQDCTEIPILGKNPYTDHQLINNTICLLLTTGLYLCPFEEWDHLLPNAQTWLALRTMIQEPFQPCLNATAPTAGHHGYAPAMPYQQNAFGILEADNSNGESFAASVATQVAALRHQSQLILLTVANTSQRHDQQMAHLASHQDLMHQNMHQIIAVLNAVTFNVSDKG